MKYFVWLFTKKAGRQVKELVSERDWTHDTPEGKIPYIKNVVLSARRME